MRGRGAAILVLPKQVPAKTNASEVCLHLKAAPPPTAGRRDLVGGLSPGRAATGARLPRAQVLTGATETGIGPWSHSATPASFKRLRYWSEDNRQLLGQGRLDVSASRATLLRPMG